MHKGTLAGDVYDRCGLPLKLPQVTVGHNMPKWPFPIMYLCCVPYNRYQLVWYSKTFPVIKLMNSYKASLGTIKDCSHVCSEFADCSVSTQLETPLT